MLDWQSLIVLAAVTAAIGYLVRRVTLLIRGAVTGCGSCGQKRGCGARVETVQHNGAELPLVSLDDPR